MKKSPKIISSAVWIVGLVIAFSILASPTVAQRKTNERKLSPGSMIRESDVDYQLWEGFQLVRKANDGEAPAQHELAIRFLQGKGFAADTIKAAYWLGKAAEQDFDFAHYNMGILTMNGWGVEWDPFGAYRHFQRAAFKNMPEAEFVLGLMATENLIVARNWKQAYNFVKKAADAGFEPAQKALVEFQRRGLTGGADSTDSAASGSKKKEELESKVKPIFLNFNIDTSSHTDDRTIFNELVREGSPELRKALGVTSGNDTSFTRDSTAYDLVLQAAEAGSPEALTVLGRLHEKGIGVSRDHILAGVYYVRAMRLESGRAQELLWNMVGEPGFPEELERKAKVNDPRAQFVWAGLVAGRIDQRLSGEQALKLLESAASRSYADALVELGLCYQSGRWVRQDRNRGLELWQSAEALGNREAKLRLAILRVFDNLRSMEESDIPFLRGEAEKGSILAQVAIGYCYETGRGLTPKKGEAAGLYRNAAQRGSESAYAALRRMHDAMRPPDKDFEMDD